MSHGVVIILLIALAAITRPAYAESCRADVENIGSKLVGNRFFTQWRIRHDSGDQKLATVYFEYKIHYKNKRGATLVETGVFRELLRGAGKQYTRENISTLDPEETISVDFDKINCSK